MFLQIRLVSSGFPGGGEGGSACLNLSFSLPGLQSLSVIVPQFRFRFP